jgi:hypothetical protein
MFSITAQMFLEAIGVEQLVLLICSTAGAELFVTCESQDFRYLGHFILNI